MELKKWHDDKLVNQTLYKKYVGLIPGRNEENIIKPVNEATSERNELIER